MATSRREFLRSVLLSGMAAGLARAWPANADAAAAAAPAQRPNILLILADDLGPGDLGYMGNDIVHTPHIDRLAADGIVLTQCYAAGPVCMPSRLALMSGRYPYRTGGRMASDGAAPSYDIAYMPRTLHEAGYATGVFGKWHMGPFPEGARAMAFDDWAICAPGGWSDFWDYTIHRPGGEEPSGGRYSTDMITDEAVGFIERHAGEPFFCYAAYTAPHFPLQAPEENMARYAGREDLPPGTRRVYGMVERLDEGIGRLVATLRRLGLLENTLIVFTSDNGPRFGGWQGLDQTRYNLHLAGEKSLVLEGGIRVPGLVHWPAGLGAAPDAFPHMLHGVDWYPTLCAAAGVGLPEDAGVDGVNYLPALAGETAPPAPRRFWAYNKLRASSDSNAAYREGPWKLHRPSIRAFNRWDTPVDFPAPDDPPDWQLFRIDSDPFERHDMADQFPDRTEAMRRTFMEWFEDTMAVNRRLARQR